MRERIVPVSQRGRLVSRSMLAKSRDHSGKARRDQVLLQIRKDLKPPSKACYCPGPSRSRGRPKMEGGGGRGWEGAEVLALAGGLWEAGLGAEGESPECWAEALLGLLEEPPPLRLSPPPPVPPLPKPRKAVQVSSSAFAFPSRCPLQVPRAALSPPPAPTMATLRVHPEAQAKVSAAGSSSDERH